MRLSIREIADWKEKGIPPQMFTKTHDGTSMGNLRTLIQKFGKEYASSDWKHMISYDENGNVVDHSQRTKFEISYLKIPNDVYDNNKNMDLITNLGREDLNASTFGVTNDEYEDKYSGFDILDYDQLLQKNKEGDYTYRSVTSVSPNGASLTIVKNKNFSEKDEQKYQEITRKMHYELKEFVNDCELDYQLEMMRNEGVVREEDSIYEGYQRRVASAMDKVISKRGTVYDFIKNNGYAERLEKECNCKLRIRGIDSNIG